MSNPNILPPLCDGRSINHDKRATNKITVIFVIPRMRDSSNFMLLQDLLIPAFARRSLFAKASSKPMGTTFSFCGNPLHATYFSRIELLARLRRL